MCAFKQAADRRKVRIDRDRSDFATRVRKEYWALKHQQWLREKELFGHE